MHSLLCVVAHVTCLRVLCITSSDVGQNTYVWFVKIVAGCNLLSWLYKEWMGKCVYPNEVMATSKVSNATVYVYLVLQLLQTNLLPMKFGKLKIWGWPINYENNKNHIPQKIVHVYLRLWKLHNMCALDRYFHEIISGLELLYCKL